MDPASSSPRPSGQPTGFAAQLHCRLRQRIIEGDLPPGTRLSEQEIADQYQLSRQPVREAFIRLAAEALLEIRPQRGTFVTLIDLDWVLGTRFIREAVEADIARLAAGRAGPGTRQMLQDHLDRQQAVPEGDTTRLARCDEEFHAALAAIAGKPAVWQHLEQMKAHLDRLRHLLATVTPREIMLAEHRAVAEAILTGDPDRAEAAIRRHLRRVLHDLPDALKLSPDYFTRAELLAERLAAEGLSP